MNHKSPRPWIFVSYRRGGAGIWAARQIAGSLEDCCGAHTVFCDTRSIQPSSEWESEILSALETSKVLVALLDSSWLSPRLADPSDWVRREIELALERRLLIVPIVIDGGAMPNPNELPGSLAPISRVQAFFIDARSESVLDASLKAVARHITDSIQARIVLSRARAWWWGKMESNTWILYLDEKYYLSLNLAETTANRMVPTGPHRLRVEWSEKEADSRYGQAYGPGRSSMGKTQSLEIAFRPGQYSLSLVPALDTRGILRRVGDFVTSEDNIPRRIAVEYDPDQGPKNWAEELGLY